ncbi:hypothetical protein BX600DRAFT_474459 [Xylariales sp. PMI_506]|nr:hypothetical protein BX600DRAFT_474459 [Xylariales sp. PMI_506]
MSMNVAVESVSAPAEIPLDGMQKLRLQSADPESRTDSGYFTQTPTPDRNSKQSSRSSSNAVDRLTTQTRVLRSSTNPLQELSEFDIQVDAATISRFSNIQPQIERALLKYVHKTPGKFRAMAIRLMVLGASAAQAKPHIVVLVAEEQYKRARKFFDKSSVQSLVRPRDETLPSFEVLIYARPPEQKQAEHDNIDVLIPMINGDLGFTTETFCGAPIIIRHLSGAEKRATFGGIIKVVDQHGNLKLYGLTAGHVVGDSDDYVSVQSSSDMNPRDDDLVLSDSEPESESESDTDCDVDELENLSNKSSKQSHDAATSWDQGDKVLMFQDSNTAWSSVELRSMGMISKDSPQMHDQSDEQTPDVQAYLDWALIDMSTYKPNHLRPRARGFDDSTNPVQSTSGDLVKPLSKSSYKGVRRSVVVISGSEGPKRGTISALPSRILLGPGKEFVDTLVVNLDAGKGM